MRINKLLFSNTAPENRYLYNNKELISDFGLDWYEYGARMYDAEIARFPSLDPKADEFAYVSPYNYAENRPIDGIDLWGLQSAGYLEIQKKIQSGNVKPYKQSTISQGQTNYMRFFNATVSPDMQKEISSNPVYKSVAVGVLATPVAENYTKAFLINLTVNTVIDLATKNYMTPIQEVKKTFNSTDIADPIISAIPGVSSTKIAIAITTSLVDITPNKGIETIGNKPIENILFDGLTNKMNDNVEKVIPNSNWAKTIESFGTPVVNKTGVTIVNVLTRLKNLKNGEKQ